MIAQFARRLLGMLGVLWAINSLAWILTEWLRVVQSQQRSFFDLPAALAGYLDYLAGIPRGDLGQMPGGDREPILSVILEALPKSLLLLGLAVAVAGLGGLVLGYLAVDQDRRRARTLALVASVLGFSMPAFYVGIIGLQAGYSMRRLTGSDLWVMPSGGFGLDDHLILPVLALAARPLTEIARLTAELTAEELGSNHVRTARAKGLPWRLVLLRHALRNALATVVTAVGGATRYLISSLVVVEVFFLWPGVGRLLARAIAPRSDGRPSFAVLFEPDLVAGLVTSLAFMALLVGLLTSLAAPRLDPRQGRMEAG